MKINSLSHAFVQNINKTNRSFACVSDAFRFIYKLTVTRIQILENVHVFPNSRLKPNESKSDVRFQHK